MSIEQDVPGSDPQDAGTQVWCPVCGRHHHPDEVGVEVEVNRGHVVAPRELAPGFWVAIDVEEDLEHARARFLTPAVLAALGRS